MRELELHEVEQVDGAIGFTNGGIAIIGLGLAGGPATGVFGLLVGGACLLVGHYQDKK